MGILEDLLDPIDVTPAASAFNCPACGAARGWIDRYGNPPHCFACFPWPALSLMADVVGDWPAAAFEHAKQLQAKSGDVEKVRSAEPEQFSHGRPALGEGAGEGASDSLSTMDASNAADAALARRIAFHEDLQRRWDRFCNRPPSAVIAIAEPA